MATHSAGSDSKDSSSSASTAQRANTTSAPQASSSAASVKAASPTTSVRSAGSDTQDNRGANVSGGGGGGNSQAFSGSTSGIAAAANMSGAQTGNRGNQNSTSDPVDRSSSMNWNQFDDMTSNSPARSMSQIANDGKFDIVDRTPSHNWMQLQDMLDAAQQPRYPGIQQPDTIDPAGSRQDFASYLHDINNGSMGMPGAVGYGTDGPAAVSTPGNSLLLGKGADSDPYSGMHNVQAFLRTVGLAPGDPVGPTTKSVPTIAIHASPAVGGPPYAGPFGTRPADAPAVADAGPLGGIDAAIASNDAMNKRNSWANAWSSLINGSDRLPSEPINPDAVAPAYTGGPNDKVIVRSVNPDGTYTDPLEAIQAATATGVSLPRRDPRGYASEMPVDSSVPLNASSNAPVAITVHGGSDTSTAPAGDKPSTWDKVVDNTGKLLSHTGLGSIVSGMFPDLWNGMGDAFKGMDNGAHGSGTTPIYNPADDLEIATRNHSSQTGGALLDFIDANGNGIDDRYESAAPAAAGIAAAANPDAAGYSGNQFRSNRYATFPDMPPYRPGVDNEWNYFHDHLARGGVVGYADRDPRVGMIADAEDALHRGDHQHASITKFVDTFGPKALEHLNTNVLAGHRMRAGMPGRTVTGPGGPTDDAVPAVIDGQHPAKLSSGEFVVPVAAVEGIGDGDPRVGADRLHALVSRFAAK